MTKKDLDELGFTIEDDSYENYHNGNHEKCFTIKSKRLDEGFSVYQDLEDLDKSEIKKREKYLFARQLFLSNEDSVEKQLMPYFLKIAQGTNLDELTAVIKIPTK